MNMEQNYPIDPNIGYDVVELPSRGIYYPNKKKSLKVAYLTASDENVLASPSLIALNGVTNEILHRKILDRDMPVDDLVEEDRQAVLIFLRNTAFGSEYTIKTDDLKTKKEFDFKVDLSILKTKPFNLKEDANGEYSYFMEKSMVNITFNFLNKKQITELDDLFEVWDENKKIDGDIKVEKPKVAPVMTKRLEMMIKSVNGNRDPLFIYNFIQNLPIIDSQSFRKYVNVNKPGLDLVQDVKTPSGDIIQVEIGFGVEFFRPFYGL